MDSMRIETFRTEIFDIVQFSSAFQPVSTAGAAKHPDTVAHDLLEHFFRATLPASCNRVLVISFALGLPAALSSCLV